MNFYLNEDLLKYKKAIKNTIFKLIALLVITVVLNVAFCLLIDRIHYLAVQLINTVLSAVCVFTVIYKIDTVIVANSKKIKHYKEIEAANKTELCGTVTKIGDVITVNSGLRGREVCLSFGRKSYSFYLLDAFSYDFDECDKVRITVAKKYITNSFIIEKSEKENNA